MCIGKTPDNGLVKTVLAAIVDVSTIADRALSGEIKQQ